MLNFYNILHGDDPDLFVSYDEQSARNNYIHKYAPSPPPKKQNNKQQHQQKKITNKMGRKKAARSMTIVPTTLNVSSRLGSVGAPQFM